MKPTIEQLEDRSCPSGNYFTGTLTPTGPVVSPVIAPPPLTAPAGYQVLTTVDIANAIDGGAFSQLYGFAPTAAQPSGTVAPMSLIVAALNDPATTLAQWQVDTHLGTLPTGLLPGIAGTQFTIGASPPWPGTPVWQLSSGITQFEEPMAIPQE